MKFVASISLWNVTGGDNLDFLINSGFFFFFFSRFLHFLMNQTEMKSESDREIHSMVGFEAGHGPFALRKVPCTLTW